jgi:hypothetical protein
VSRDDTGIIQEGCTNSNATVTNLRAVAKRSRELGGVPLVYECHANCKSITDPDHVCISSIAAFLVGAGPHAYWGFGGWVEAGGVEPPLADRWGPLFEVSMHTICNGKSHLKTHDCLTPGKQLECSASNSVIKSMLWCRSNNKSNVVANSASLGHRRQMHDMMLAVASGREVSVVELR